MRKTILLVVVAGACGGVGTNDLARQLVDAFCQNAVTCQQAPDLATCKASVSFSGNAFLTDLADSNGSKVKYDSGAAGSCVDHFKNAGCGFTGFRTDFSNPCLKVFAGTLAVGAACFTSEECSGQALCTHPMTSTCDPNTTCCTDGTCTAPATKGAVGATCMFDSDCQDALYCGAINTTTNIGSCTAVVTMAGGACDQLTACANPQYCNLNFTTGMGTCVTAAARNATCDPAALIPCADSRDFCDMTAKKCTQALAVGATCDPMMFQCEALATCDAATTKCISRAVAGTACTILATGSPSVSCLLDLSCRTSAGPCAAGTAGCTCALPAAGMACH